MLASLLPLALSIIATAPAQQDPARAALEDALRRYFAADDATGPALQAAASAARGHEDLLIEILRTKSFVLPRTAPLARHGTIDASCRFRELAPEAPRTDNDALLYGPAPSAELAPLVVYVPDSTRTAPYPSELEREAAQGRFVFLVPDADRDNQWKPTPSELRRHAGPLRDLLLENAIDPDRVYFAGSGRGGHAAWAVGLLYADRFAGVCPCNGGPICEGSYVLSGGVFLENARSLVMRAVYNTTFDHGLEGCRYAASKFAAWGYRFEGVEEKGMRVMDVAEAMTRLGGATRDAHPRALVKRFNHLDAGEHYWLRALERTPREWDPQAKITLRGDMPADPLQQREKIWEYVQGQCARLQAAIAGERITIQTQGIGKLRVYFDPELVEHGKKLTVTLNGKAQPPVTPKRDLEVLLRHVHETGDTARLYWDARDYATR